MTVLIFTNPTKQHAQLHYRVSSHADRVETLEVPFNDGTAELNLSSLTLEKGEAEAIKSQLDVQARALGLRFKEK